MKRFLAVVLAGALVAGFVGATPAIGKKKKPKKKLVPVEAKYFLRDSDGCDTGVGQLSLQDGEDTGCWYVDNGAVNDAYIAGDLLTREDLEQTFVAADGVPFTLDATKHVTGEIYTAGGNCVVGTYTGPGGPITPPCSPAQLKGGNVTLEVVVQGTTGGTETVLGTFTEEFTVKPGDPTHKSAVDITLESALNKLNFETLEVAAFIHGNSVGNGIIELDDPASFINVPTLVKK